MGKQDMRIGTLQEVLLILLKDSTVPRFPLYIRAQSTHTHSHTLTLTSLSYGDKNDCERDRRIRNSFSTHAFEGSLEKGTRVADFWMHTFPNRWAGIRTIFHQTFAHTSDKGTGIRCGSFLSGWHAGTKVMGQIARSRTGGAKGEAEGS